jgi:hypothetical protein
LKALVTPKHLVKEDGKTAKVEEKSTSKSLIQQGTKRIILSHSRVFEDTRRQAK